MDRPILGTEALGAGSLTRRTLASRHDAIYRNVYLRKGTEMTAATRAVAAWLWSGRRATLAGLSAAALYGTRWIDGNEPAELYRRNGKPVDGILIHRDELADDETRVLAGIPATTPARTAFDLGRRHGRDWAVSRLDALGQATGVCAADVVPLLQRHRGARGLVQLREVLELMDGGAESPPESRTRLVLIDAGLPRPRTQIVVPGDFLGRRCARIDMGYEEFKVGVEYEGAQHWTDPAVRTNDIDRYAELAAQGWITIRVSSDILRHRPHVIVARTCEALQVRGAQWPVIARILGDRVA
ncbi:endonuclease domain-containing protein [Mycobacterium sp. LTG2003]